MTWLKTLQKQLSNLYIFIKKWSSMLKLPAIKYTYIKECTRFPAENCLQVIKFKAVEQITKLKYLFTHILETNQHFQI